MRIVKAVLLGVVIAVLFSGIVYCDQEPAIKDDISSPNVSLDVKDIKASEVFKSLAKQSNAKIILETSVKGNITASVNKISLEKALDAICKSEKIEWREVYVASDSKLIEKPDKLASTIRLISGLSFPDVVVASTSKGKSAVNLTNTKIPKSAEDSLVKELGMVKVYLITNDAAAAAKAIADEKNKAVEDYVNSQKQQMDSFMKMTPEEREQALLASLNLMDQVGPSYMSDMMKSLMNTNPDLLKQISARQTQMLFDMAPEDRRAMIKMNMQMQGMITDEQKKMLEEDVKAVMQEMKSDQ